jgi:hypothetical protein
VSTTTLRNVAIIVLLALAVFALPSGGLGASIIEALLSIAFGVAIWLFLMRMYREHRVTIFGLGERYRAVLYASFCGLLFAGASARRWWDTAPLTLLWMALLGACAYGLYATYRHWREYG